MKRKILCSTDKEILRWGYEEKGSFTTKEAYNLIMKENMVKNPIWSKVWDSNNWPKISTFLWLLSHNRTLTWDNLRKGNIMDPPCAQSADKMRKPQRTLCSPVLMCASFGKKSAFVVRRRAANRGKLQPLSAIGTGILIKVQS